MGDSIGSIVLGMAGLALLAGLASMFLSFKNWRLYTIFLLFLNLAAGFGFMYLSAKTLAIYRAWGKEEQDWNKTATTMIGTADDLRLGKADGKDDIEKTRVDELRLNLNKALEGRGPAWGIIPNSLKPKDNIGADLDPLLATFSVEGNRLKAVLTFRTEQPPVGLVEKTQLYLFLDTSLAPQFKLSGDLYLGFFNVDSVNGKTVNLTSINPIDPKTTPPAGRDRPVIAYVKFPNDDYRAFAGMSADEIRALLPTITAQDLLELTKHGKPVTEAEAEQLTAVDPSIVDPVLMEQEKKAKADSIQYRVRMKAPYDTAAGAAQAAPMPGEDGAPAATPGKKYGTIIPVGGKAILPIAAAEELIAAGKAELDGADYRVYQRPLRDFPNGYQHDIEARKRVEQSIAETDRLIALNAATNASTAATIEIHKTRIKALEQDAENLKKETAVLDGYITSLRQSAVALRQRRDALETGIENAAVQVAQLQLEAVRKINARLQAQESAAATP
ncbi:MAG: hypothetical protein QM811_04635 [Pirellulales bacterium]